MVAIEKENPTLKGVLTKDYARPSLDKTRLGELIDRVSTIGLGSEANRSKDILGRVYEYFLIDRKALEDRLPAGWGSVKLGDLCEESAFGPRSSGKLYSASDTIATLRTTDLVRIASKTHACQAGKRRTARQA